uniref:Uncharacterized protein n=1 Tax=Oryza sativa subsp. japonica TaxID=39947 RepID=Q6Z385_ORYSJ|nr:hypothetical protein [Oryza sativa Japonica Group]
MLALRGRAVCLNFANPAWLLAVPPLATLRSAADVSSSGSRRRCLCFHSPSTPCPPHPLRPACHPLRPRPSPIAVVALSPVRASSPRARVPACCRPRVASSRPAPTSCACHRPHLRVRLGHAAVLATASGPVRVRVRRRPRLLQCA